MRLGHAVTEDELASEKFDAVVLATGVTPRRWVVEGVDHPKVAYYDEVLSGARPIGQSIAIVGAGGIGFDVASWLLDGHAQSDAISDFMAAWGVDPSPTAPGGLLKETAPPRTPRRIALFQRRKERLGGTLGKTTGWVLKAKLRRGGVGQHGGVTYRKVDDAGLHYSIDGEDRVMACDNVIVCAGQEASQCGLHEGLKARGVTVHLVGGAELAAELDAVRAIEHATRLALAL